MNVSYHLYASHGYKTCHSVRFPIKLHLNSTLINKQADNLLICSIIQTSYYIPDDEKTLICYTKKLHCKQFFF